MNGKIKWFSIGKGFGVITCEDGTEVLAHQSQIKTEDLEKLSEGVDISFDLISEPNGLQAKKIIVL